MIIIATIKDVAKRAGVSVATVSAVINENSNVNVSEKLRKKTLKAIDELNYRPNRLARALSKNRTHTIAYFVPSIHNQVFSQMANLIENIAFDNGYSVYLCNTNRDFKRVKLYAENFIDSRVDGIITTLTWEIIETDVINQIKESNISIVGMAGARVVDYIDTVTINDVGGSKLATEHLINKGKKNIGFLGIKYSRTTERRIQGFKEACKENGLEVKEDLIFYSNKSSRELGFNLTEDIVKNNKIDALLVYNDVMAAGVIDKLRCLGVKVPEEIAVIGFDDSVSAFTKPKLSTIVLPKRQLAKSAMDILFKRINNDKSEVIHKEFLPNLIVRESS